jgi:TP901 family phage tail tape measure protein
MANVVADAVVALRADLSRYRQDLRGAEAESGRSGGRMGAAMGGAFRAGGAAMGVALAGSIELAANFEDQLRTINTVAGLSDQELAALGDNIQQLARDSGKGTEDLTAAYYDLVSAGVPANQAMDVLRNSATLATGALSTTGESVDLITSALNAYGMDASESARLTDIFALAVQNGKVTAAELAGSIANIAPIAASAGVEIEEVAAGYANLTAKGVPAAQASTQMRAAISALLTPNETLNRLQQQTGINFAELARDQGLSVALEKLREVTEANGSALDKLATVSGEDFPAALKAAQDELGLTNTDVEKFAAIAGEDGAAAAINELTQQVGEGDSAMGRALGSIEAYSFSLNTTGAAFEDAQAGLGEFQSGVDGLALEQATEKMNSPAEAAGRLTQTVLTFMQDVGGPFASSVGPMLLTLNNLGPVLGGLISPAKLAGGAIGAMAGQLASGAASLIPTIGGAFAAAGSAIGGVFTAAAGAVIAAWPLVLLALVVGAIAVLLTNPEVREKALEIGRAIIKAIGDALAAIGQVVGTAVGTVLRFFGDMAGRVGGIAAGLARTVVGFITAIPGRVAGFVGGLLGLAGRAASGIASAIGTGIGRAVGFVLGLPGRVISGWLRLGSMAVDAASRIVRAIVDGAARVVRTILGIPARAAGFVGDLIGMAGKAVSGFIGQIAAIPGKVGEILGGIGDFIGGFIPSFQTGTLYAPEGLAYLHAGEMVIPAAQAAVLRGAMAGGAPTDVAAGAGNITVEVQGLVYARSTQEIGEGLRRLGEHGVLTPRRRYANG